MAAGSGATGGAAADAVARAHAAMLQDPTLQFRFEALKPPEPPAWLKPLLEVLAQLAPLMVWIFWGGLALGLGMVLFFIARELIRVRWPERRRRDEAAKPKDEWRPSPEAARALLQDADRLAAEGRFAEAARLLLHRSIEDFEGRRPRAVRPSLTARDIAGLDSLPAPARPPFEKIATVVERSFFGGRPVDASAFAECRSAYEAFAFPGAWT